MRRIDCGDCKYLGNTCGKYVCGFTGRNRFIRYIPECDHRTANPHTGDKPCRRCRYSRYIDKDGAKYLFCYKHKRGLGYDTMNCAYFHAYSHEDIYID